MKYMWQQSAPWACKYRFAAQAGIVRLNTFSVLLVTHPFPFITTAIFGLRERVLMEWQLLSCESGCAS
jgi:hypothetical protein